MRRGTLVRRSMSLGVPQGNSWLNLKSFHYLSKLFKFSNINKALFFDNFKAGHSRFHRLSFEYSLLITFELELVFGMRGRVVSVVKRCAEECYFDSHFRRHRALHAGPLEQNWKHWSVGVFNRCNYDYCIYVIDSKYSIQDYFCSDCLVCHRNYLKKIWKMIRLQRN